MLGDLKQELELIVTGGGERHFYPALSRRGGCVSIRGRTVIDFASWDLFDLNNHPPFVRAVERAVHAFGVCGAASRASAGTAEIHLACERRLAEFTGFEAATIFSSKNQAVFSLVTALASERDVVVFDEQMLSPVGDAAYLVNGPTATYPGGNLSRARHELEKARGARRRLLFVESVSPVTGEAIDVAAWCAVAQKTDSHLIVDESYALGVVGLRGAGGVEALPLKSAVAAVYGDSGLILGGTGGFLAGASVLVRYVMQRSRTFVNEVSPAPFGVAALEAAISTIELAHVGRERLSANAGKLRNGLVQMGALKSCAATGPLVCVPFRSHRMAREVSEALFQKGVLAEALVRPIGGSAPSPEGGAYLRFLVSSVHTPSQLESTLEACAEIWSKLER